jgi:hypothetical protein
MVNAAIGLRAHSGWAALVGVTGGVDAPAAVISRRRIVIADPSFPGSKQPYHFVESMPLSEASAIVARCWKSSVDLAVEALASETKSLAAKGFEANVCGVLQGRLTEMPPLEKILVAHPLLHTAEGVMFRQVLVMAAEACGMRVLQIPEKGLVEHAAKILHVPASDLMPRLKEMGRGLGSPWTLDQKYATAAAWMASVVC